MVEYENIDNKLARCLNIYQAQDVLKDYLYVLSVCSQNFECQTIKKMLLSLVPTTADDKNFITYCQNVKLEKKLPDCLLMLVPLIKLKNLSFTMR